MMPEGWVQVVLADDEGTAMVSFTGRVDDVMAAVRRYEHMDDDELTLGEIARRLGMDETGT